MEVIRFFFILLAIVTGFILIPLGGYYLIYHSPILINSYTLINGLYVAAGLILLLSAVFGAFDLARDNDSPRQLLLAAISIIMLGGGYGYYRYYTTQIYSVPVPPFQSNGSFAVDTSSDFWISPITDIKPNQSISIFSRQPFHVALGSIEASSFVDENGMNTYNMLTTNIDFTSFDERSGLTEVTTKDRLRFKLTQETTATTAGIFVKIEDRDNYDLAKKAESDYRWSRMTTLLSVFIVLCLTGTGAFFGGKALHKRHRMQIIENKRKARLKAEKDKIRKQQREEETRVKKAKEEEQRARELEERQAEFAKKVTDIDPDTLFED
ncbi:MAG TPA: MAP7 domain-containing protein [Pyrinomonadaceae bacterium]|jgi:hypothetical protein